MSDVQAVHAQDVLMHDALSTARSDTLEWISAHPKLSAWMSLRVSDSKTKNRLALVGPLSHGKPSVAAVFVDNPSERGSIVCFHVFGQESAPTKNLSSKTREAIELAKLSESILSQLLASRPELKPTMHSSMKAWSNKPRVTPAFAAKAPLLHWLPDFIADSQQQTFIVLHGLSEILEKTTYDHVLSFMEYVTDLTDNVRVLVTSQGPVLAKTVDAEQNLFTNILLPEKLAGDLAVAAASQSSIGSRRNLGHEMARL